jgi:hypothetical protein
MIYRNKLVLQASKQQGAFSPIPSPSNKKKSLSIIKNPNKLSPKNFNY